ncbi:MAG: glutathione S-transferase N-terminal domain-containing protein [Gammaproteobacteria bacterium]|nr:glutathione S-transferase N-terminal domain-containing protein [Gammaproteobacteria bacterium]MDE0271262.1 glutathione S-transferase N-terminal domain-containing protein [Gammaproteobacteria bacterium]
MNLGDRQSSMLLYSDPRDQYSHRVRMMLAEKGVIVDLVDVDAEKPPAELASQNPYNTVPTLTDRDLVLYDANIIMQYLDERFPHPPLLPVYPVERALARLWVHRIDREWSSKLDPLIAGQGSEAVQQQTKADLRASLSDTAPIFSQKPFFMNEEFTLVDCCVAPILWRLKAAGIVLRDRRSRPLRNYMQQIFERDSFQKSLTEAEQEMGE